jgi:hypothetical protein
MRLSLPLKIYGPRLCAVLSSISVMRRPAAAAVFLALRKRQKIPRAAVHA